MKSPRISVVMPAWNASAYLEAAVASILSQSCAEFELIAVDDGSTDATREMLDSISRRDQRLRVISIPNSGISRALNVGLNVARGEYLARMDADDLALPQRLARQMDFLDAHSDVVAVGSSVEKIDPEGEVLGVSRMPQFSREIEDQLLRNKGHGMWHPSVMMRRAAVLAVGGYDERFKIAQDRDLWLRLSEIGGLHNLPEVLLRYRLHEKNVSGRRHRRLVLGEAHQVLTEACRRRGLSVRTSRKWFSSSLIPGAHERHYWVRLARRNKNWRVAMRHAVALARTRWWSPLTWWMLVCFIPSARSMWKTFRSQEFGDLHNETPTERPQEILVHHLG